MTAPGKSQQRPGERCGVMMDDGKPCGRAARWPGHLPKYAYHDFQPPASDHAAKKAELIAQAEHRGDVALFFVSHFSTCPDAAKFRKKG